MSKPQAPAFQHAETAIDTVYGTSRLHCFAFSNHEEDNVLCIRVLPTEDDDGLTLVRIQSACYTGEIFRSSDCDCHDQLDQSLRLIHGPKGGLFVYMICDGRGAGLLTKIRGLALGESEGLDTYEAYQALGVEPDPRSYVMVTEVLRYFAPARIALLTNNPRKVKAVSDAGIPVERRSLEIPPTPKSYEYLNAKRTKFGHLIDPHLF